MSLAVRHVEGVRYYRFLVTFKLTDGRRRRWTRWSPGHPWVRSEVMREIQDRFDPSEIKPGSGKIEGPL